MRLDGETWRDAVARIFEHLGCAWEALARFDILRQTNDGERAYRMVRHEYSLGELFVV